MPETIAIEKSLAEAVTKLVDSLYHRYPGIMIKSISNYEDEDFTFEITIPKDLPIDQVEDACHMECIKTEDDYDLFILPKVVYEQ
ncbi:MAG: hypothetical protein KAI50_09905 [Desulfobacterales bacterium]|nr:hypothetical protein [Desulfobacterales bacterium]